MKTFVKDMKLYKWKTKISNWLSSSTLSLSYVANKNGKAKCSNPVDLGRKMYWDKI